MAEIIDPEGFTSLRDEEINSERSAITSALAGVVSGVIKVPEGVISLGAELIDLGFDTDLAADVEQMFDKFNIFEDIADDTCADIAKEDMTWGTLRGTRAHLWYLRCNERKDYQTLHWAGTTTPASYPGRL